MADSDDPGGARPYIRRAQALLTPETIKLYPQEALGLALLPADALWRENHVREAADELDSVASMADSTAGDVRDTHMAELGNRYMTLGKLRLAEQVFENLSNPGGRSFWLAVLALLRDKPTDLREYSGRLDRGGEPLDSSMPPVLMARAGLLVEAERALSDRRKHWAGDTDVQGAVRVMEAELALARGQLSRAVSLFQEGLSSNLGRRTLTFLAGTEALARGLERQGNRAEAVRVLETATSEGSPVTFGRGFYWIRHRWLLAQLYRKDGRAQDAERIEEHLRRLLVCADPDFPLLLALGQRTAVNPMAAGKGH